MSEDKWTIERVDGSPVLYRWGELSHPPTNDTVWFHDEMQEAREKAKQLQAKVKRLEAESRRINQLRKDEREAKVMAQRGVNKLQAKAERLEAEQDWWHERAWEIDSEYEFHNGSSVLHRESWEAKQAAIREADDE